MIVLIGFAGTGKYTIGRELSRRTGAKLIEMLKQISPEAARRRALEHSVLSPSHPNLRTIDVTRKSPTESVEAVLAEVRSIKDK